MYLNHEQKEIMKAFLNKSFLQKLLYIGRGLDIAEAIASYARSGAYVGNGYSKLVNLIWTKDTKHMNEAFAGKDFGALKLLLGEQKAQTFKAIWDRAPLYTYSIGYYRRSYRTNISTNLYLQAYIEKLMEFTYLEASGFSLDQYLDGVRSKDQQDISVIADMIALELDNGNQEVLGKIHDTIYNDNNAAILTRQIIQGVLMSRNKNAHMMVGELLLAAKLQEGLRQTIVEAADECSKEAFTYILKLIMDNNLYRFSSVVRAFGTWTGLGIEAENTRVIQKCMETAYSCLTEKDYVNNCINSNDSLLIYIGLWAVAFNEIEDINPLINTLLKAEIKSRKLAALQFLYEIQFPIFRHKTASLMLQDRDLEVVALAVKNLFSDLHTYNFRGSYRDELKSYNGLGKNLCGTPLFYQLKEIADRMPKKAITFEKSVFPWVNFEFSTAEVLEKMLYTFVLERNNEALDTFLDYRDRMGVDTRATVTEYMLSKPETPKQKLALLELCGDRSSSIRDTAFKTVNKMALTGEDYLLIEGLLQYKSGDLRKSAIKLLLKQSSSDLAACVERLASSSNSNMRMAAIDIAGAMAADTKHKAAYKQCMELVATMEGKTQKEEMLKQSIITDTEERKSKENGYGLYNKDSAVHVPMSIPSKDFRVSSIFNMTELELKQILGSFSSLIHQYREMEYQTVGWDGSKTTVILGGSDYLRSMESEEKGINAYPLAEEMKNLGHQIGASKLMVLDFYMELYYWMGQGRYVAWFEGLMDKNFQLNVLKACLKEIKEIPYFNLIRSYIGLLEDALPAKEKFEAAIGILEHLYKAIPLEKHNTALTKTETNLYYVHEHYYIAGSREIDHWLVMARENQRDEEDFIRYFQVAYNYYQASKYTLPASLGLEHFGRALELGLINEDEVYREFMARRNSPNNIRNFTSSHKRERETLSQYTGLMQIGERVVDTIASIEVTRGELNTEVSHLAASINKCYGVDIFTAIILGSEKDTYVRGYNFVSGDCTKKQIFSHLLKCCYPKPEDTAESLKQHLNGKKISTKQLIEAAMYAPQWLGIISDYLGIEGLMSACWYFHAHVNEEFSDDKAAMVARYTPIALQDLKDGAFDQQWFMEAYQTIGEKNFKLVYDSAKYIAGGGLHKRSQLFADAVLGKLDKEEVKNRIADKRNKDYLLIYGLVPIQDKEDLLQRYEFIHRFMKESKQFGAQRQASEGRSANIALLNLARNAGYSDINRLNWNMETAKLDSIRVYLEPHKLDEIDVQLAIDEAGQAEILCSKEGKRLKDVPSKYKKADYIVELKSIRKSLREQYSRARHSFEAAMEKGDEFLVEELTKLCTNPVLSPIIKKLVYLAEGKLGYFDGAALVDYEGQVYPLKPEAKVLIAHPVHLYESGAWAHYQRDLFLKKLIQPFKQIFRELYLPNADELKEPGQSRRYAGHQVQPKKTLALLKTRGWIASYEEGLQKVYYGENIVATIYAMADWFTPAEIEAPTIECVRFEDRKSFQIIPLDKVPKLIFSEVMRDVDLVVSVAHAGGVDPEASLSTIEIRKVIAEELTRLMKLNNVRFQGNHAHIQGKYGEYTIHLGSGVVHKMAAGSINILPVHSSHRGRLFLPFMDDDPRSAEIMSKLILLAEDNKIKDPSILEQITL